ncbi:hypothetical protein VaNZ11_003219, partial [Volvox africanus]
MDWLKGSILAAQKQAQEAAEKAKALAQQASVQARAIAEQASEQAKALAEQATEQAKIFAEQASEKAKQASEKAKVLATAAAEEAQARLQVLSAQTTITTSGSTSDTDPAELAKYGVTAGLLETVAGMTYSTFSDYPVEMLASTNPMGLASPIPPPGFRLTPWQERHALLVLTRGDQLQGLRFALCPKRMSEEMFWIIYFTLVKALLPPEAFAKASATGPAWEVAGQGVLGSAYGSAKSLRASSNMPISTHSSTSRLAEEVVPTAAATTSARTIGAVAAGTSAASTCRTSVEDEGVLVDMGASSHSGEGEGDEDEDGAEGGEADLDALEDDPELAAYLEEALDVAEEGGDGEGLSDLGSATD